jgi:flagellar protein FlaG
MLAGFFLLEGVILEIQPTSNTIQPATPRTEAGSPAAAPKTAAPVQTADAVRQAASVPSMEKLADAVKNINKALKEQAQGVEFSIDSETDRTVVKIVDKNTKEVLRQIPNEETLEIARALDKAQGLLIREKA